MTAKCAAMLMVLACDVTAGCAGNSIVANHSKTHGSPAPQPITRQGAPTAFAASKGVPLAGAASHLSILNRQNGPPPITLAGDAVFVTTGTSCKY